MLTRRKLCALSPGQWARVRVPDFDCWRESPHWSAKPGDVVDICIMPRYGPRYESETCFHWTYQVAYRKHGTSYPTYESPRGLWISPSDFWLHPSTEFYYDSKEQHDYWDGKGKYLYEPASDDPELCPGGNYSTYRCDQCKKYVKPFSSDEGELVCPWCDVAGLVILDDEQLDRLEGVREFARSMGLSEQLERQLDFLANYARHDGEPIRQCVLSHDFAPRSFSFAHFVLPKYAANGQRSFWFNGALIFQAPSCPADGSFPSLTVSLASGTGWFCHT